VTTSKTRKAELHDLLTQAVLSQLLVLKCCNMLMPTFGTINTSQPNNWSYPSISKGSVSDIIQDLGYLKVCERWVPQNLTNTNQTKRKAVSSELLACFEAAWDILSWTVIVDETWDQHFEQETKRQSTEWYHLQSLWKKKLKKSLSMDKAMITILCDCK
jgi:hypothetical protein